MVRKMIPGIHYSITPEAQRVRSQWLEPDAIRARLREWAARGDEYWVAISLIRMTELMQRSPAQQLALIKRVLDGLAELEAEGE
jgi:hypothetical protein